MADSVIKDTHHTLYIDGTPKKISWVLETDQRYIAQWRDHAELYLCKVSDIQSRYIALHVGLFWSIGTFHIRDYDNVDVMLHDENMFNQITTHIGLEDEFIKTRTRFINQFIKQRNLSIQYILGTETNPAKISTMSS